MTFFPTPSFLCVVIHLYLFFTPHPKRPIARHSTIHERAAYNINNIQCLFFLFFFSEREKKAGLPSMDETESWPENKKQPSFIFSPLHLLQSFLFFFNIYIIIGVHTNFSLFQVSEGWEQSSSKKKQWGKKENINNELQYRQTQAKRQETSMGSGGKHHTIKDTPRVWNSSLSAFCPKIGPNTYHTQGWRKVEEKEERCGKYKKKEYLICIDLYTNTKKHRMRWTHPPEHQY
jgi:hypothetical protein